MDEDGGSGAGAKKVGSGRALKKDAAAIWESLSDYQSQTGKNITQKLVKDSINSYLGKGADEDYKKDLYGELDKKDWLIPKGDWGD